MTNIELRFMEVVPSQLMKIATALETISKKENTMWAVTHTTISMNDYDANGHTSTKVFTTEAKAKAQLKQWRKEELDFAKEEERDPEIYVDEDDEFRMGWCAASEQLRIMVTPVVIDE